MLRLIAAFVIAVTTLLPVADAQADRLIRTQAPPLRHACFTDYMKYCRDVRLGGGRAINCLNAHADQLSQQCFQALTVRGLAYAGALKLCRADYERLCQGGGQGWGRSLQCMRSHAAQLSPVCRNALRREGFLDGGPDLVP